MDWEQSDNGLTRIPVVVPSAGRPGRVEVLKWLPDATVVVPDRDYDAYRRAYTHSDIRSLPSSHSRGVAASRQWIIENFSDVFMIDDDIKGMMAVYGLNTRKLSGPVAREVIDSTAHTARSMGVYMFGFSKNVKPHFFSPDKPFSLVYDISGWGCGVLSGHNLAYDTSMLVGEDTYLSLMNAYLNRMSFVDLRFAMFGNKIGRNPGGCSEFRTGEVMKESYFKLKRLFGDCIADTALTSKAIPLSEYSYTVRFPF